MKLYTCVFLKWLQFNLPLTIGMPPKAKKESAPMEECTGYCVKCRASKTMQNCVKDIAKNGRPMLKGSCVDCSTKMNKFVK